MTRKPKKPPKFELLQTTHLGNHRYKLKIDIGKSRPVTRHVRVMPRHLLQALRQPGK